MVEIYTYILKHDHAVFLKLTCKYHSVPHVWRVYILFFIFFFSCAGNGLFLWPKQNTNNFIGFTVWHVVVHFITSILRNSKFAHGKLYLENCIQDFPCFRSDTTMIDVCVFFSRPRCLTALSRTHNETDCGCSLRPNHIGYCVRVCSKEKILLCCRIVCIIFLKAGISCDSNDCLCLGNRHTRIIESSLRHTKNHQHMYMPLFDYYQMILHVGSPKMLNTCESQPHCKCKTRYIRNARIVSTQTHTHAQQWRTRSLINSWPIVFSRQSVKFSFPQF